MEYTVNKLAALAGVSPRTLRYYDRFGLLPPARVTANGYRVYGPAQVDQLQQILFYRELGMPLANIKQLLSAADFDRTATLEQYLEALIAKRGQVDALIANVKKTLKSIKGGTMMADKEKFDGFGQQLVDANEKQYGAEIRAKYGDAAVDQGNAKVRAMGREAYAEVEKLSLAVMETLKAAFELGDPAGPLAQKACALHQEWLCRYYDGYTREYHQNLAQMYVDDPRFAKYYDSIAPGCALFLRDAIMVYCK